MPVCAHVGDSGRSTACAPINIDFKAEMWKENGEPLDVTLAMQKRLVHITLLPEGEWATSIIILEVLDSAMQVIEERASNKNMDESAQVYLTSSSPAPSSQVSESNSSTVTAREAALMPESLSKANKYSGTTSCGAPNSPTHETPAHPVRGSPHVLCSHDQAASASSQ